MTDTLEHFTKGSIVALVCVAAILKFILSKRDEKTGKSDHKSLLFKPLSRCLSQKESCKVSNTKNG